MLGVGETRVGGCRAAAAVVSGTAQFTAVLGAWPASQPASQGVSRGWPQGRGSDPRRQGGAEEDDSWEGGGTG